MKRFLCLVTILVIVALSAPAFAVDTIILTTATSGTGWTSSGWATSTGKSGAPGATGAVGSLYSPSTSSFGPGRIVTVSFAPTAAQAGYYDIKLCWPMSAGEKQTAVTLFTGATSGGSGSVDSWGNTGAPAGVITAGTMDMYNKNTATWNKFTTAKLSSGTTYKLGVYAGYLAPGVDGASTSNRVCLAGVEWLSCTPTVVTMGGPADGATGIVAATGASLAWTPGQYNSLFDVYFGTAADPATKIGTNLVEGTSSINTGALLAGTTYHWKVVAKNADLFTSSAIYSFTTAAVPEPGSMLALGTGLIGLLGMIRRKKS